MCNFRCACVPSSGTVRRWCLFIHVSGSSVTVSRHSPATPHDASSPWRRSRSLRCVLTLLNVFLLQLKQQKILGFQFLSCTNLLLFFVRKRNILEPTWFWSLNLKSPWALLLLNYYFPNTLQTKTFNRKNNLQNNQQ